MMSKQDGLENPTSYGARMGLDPALIDECLKTGKYVDAIAKDRALAGMFNITGVPAFILARPDPDNPLKYKAISVIVGAQPLGRFKQEIDQALGKLEP